MTRSPPHTPEVGGARFRLGAFACTVVTDGMLDLKSPPRSVFVECGGAAVGGTIVADLLAAAGLSVEESLLHQNILVVDTGARRVLFDAGSGADRDFGFALYGGAVGRTAANLRAAGIAPERIDVVCLTHPHPDHCWGLVEDGRMTYPNAEVAVPAADLDDLEAYEERLASPDLDPALRAVVVGALRSLKPYREAGRLRRLADGEQVVPGVTAHAAPGHSRGHLMYRVESGGHGLMVLGDVAHHHVLQLARPEVVTIYDHDQPAAVRTRVRLLLEAAATGAVVHAFHFPYPGLGRLEERDGCFRWLPSTVDPAGA